MSTLHYAGTAAGAPGALLTPLRQRTLAEGIRSGESSAEEELVRLFADRVMFLALTRTRDPEAARDLKQDVMLAVVRALRNGQLRDAERLTAFVYGIAGNLINNYLRARRGLREDPIDEALELPGTADLGDTERRGVVRRVLSAFDSVDRTILLLTLVEGLKPGEIAIRLGLTATVVRTRKSRAVKKLTERVKRLLRK